jgi:light-regulated signal transduction histidine kinase (bacteriophytochrome)
VELNYPTARWELAELRHILRTPINHIMGYAELLLEDSEVNANSVTHLTRIISAAKQTLATVQQQLKGSDLDNAPAVLGNLAEELQNPLNTIAEETNQLESIETAIRLEDVKRILSAVQELRSLVNGHLPQRPAFVPSSTSLFKRETPQRNTARILVVDDSEPTRQLLCRLLSRQGYSCDLVNTGNEALQLLAEDHFDLVLLDLMMPGINGLDTLQAIKCDPKLEETAVIMLSAIDELDQIGQCFELGAEDYLLKPFDRVILDMRIRAVLERKRLQNMERRRTLELELADAELRRSNDELRRFASVVSHDLQEPLRMVTSYLQLLQRGLPNLTEDQRDYLAYAIDGGRRMSDLIQDLLAYSRVSAGEPTHETVDCAEVIAEVRRHLKAAMEESGAEVRHGELPKITADCSQIRQLFQNLIANAIKYRGQEKPVVQINAEKQGDWWQFSVADNGIGIEPRYYQRIFEMFSRLHDGSIPGTGIGLAICQRVVERLGGKIWVESQLGLGSTFYFTIPA